MQARLPALMMMQYLQTVYYIHIDDVHSACRICRVGPQRGDLVILNCLFMLSVQARQKSALSCYSIKYRLNEYEFEWLS